MDDLASLERRIRRLEQELRQERTERRQEAMRLRSHVEKLQKDFVGMVSMQLDALRRLCRLEAPFIAPDGRRKPIDRVNFKGAAWLLGLHGYSLTAKALGRRREDGKDTFWEKDSDGVWRCTVEDLYRAYKLISPNDPLESPEAVA